MCVKLPFRDLNPDSYPPHLTSTYTYEMTIAPKVCSGSYTYYIDYLLFDFCLNIFFFVQISNFRSLEISYYLVFFFFFFTF